MRCGAIRTARIIDFPQRISIARTPAKPWTFICNLMNDTPTRSGFARLENSEFDPSILLSRARDDTIGAFDRIKNPINALWILLFSRDALQTLRSNRFAILDGRFELLAQSVIYEKGKKKGSRIRDEMLANRIVLNIRLTFGNFTFFHRRDIKYRSYVVDDFSNISERAECIIDSNTRIISECKVSYVTI